MFFGLTFVQLLVLLVVVMDVSLAIIQAVKGRKYTGGFGLIIILGHIIGAYSLN